MDSLADSLVFVLLELDYKSINSLSCTSNDTQCTIDTCALKCNLWYTKLVALTGKRLLSRPNFDWRTVYGNFEAVTDQADLFNKSIDHLDTIKVVIELYGRTFYSSIDKIKIKQFEVLEYVSRSREIVKIGPTSKRNDLMKKITKLIQQVVARGDLDTLKSLTQKHPVLLTWSCLTIAVRENRDEILQYLLDNGRALQEDEVSELVKMAIERNSVVCLDVLRSKYSIEVLSPQSHGLTCRQSRLHSTRTRLQIN